MPNLYIKDGNDNDFYIEYEHGTGASGTPAQFGINTADFDSGAGTDYARVMGIYLPGAGGGVIGGTATNPLRFDPTNDTKTATTVADGDDASLGTTTDTISAAGANATVQSQLKRLTTDIDAIKTAVQLLDNMISGNEGQVDVVTSALPSGAATEATVDAIKTAVEVLDNIVSGNEAQVDVVTLPGTVASDITAIKTAVEILDNVVSGSEAQVDVLTLPSDPLGASADLIVAAGDEGTISAKLRRLTNDMDRAADVLEGLTSDSDEDTLPSGTLSGPFNMTRRRDTPVSGTTTDGYYSGEISDQLGAKWVHAIGGDIKSVQVTMTASTDTHGAGDVIADTQVAAALFRANDLGGVLQSINVIDKGKADAAMDIWVLRANHQVGAESAVIDITDTEALDVVWIEEIAAADWKDGGTHGRYDSGAIGEPVMPVTGTDDLYVAVVARGAITPGASDLVVEIGVLQN